MAEFITREELHRNCEVRHLPTEKDIELLRGHIKELFGKIDSMMLLLAGVLCSVIAGVVVQLLVVKSATESPQPVEIRLTVDREGKLMGADK